MARFGLDSDSSDDELPHASGSGSAHSSSQESEDEAPPRASLAQSDDDMTDDYDNDNSQLDQDEDDEDEDDEESEGYVEEPSYLAQRARSSTRAVSQTPSAANLGDDEDFTEDEEMSASDAGTEDSTRTVADQLAVRKSASVAGSVRSEAWGKKLGLEPKRVAVMQASFFHQGDDASTGGPKVNGLGGLKRTGSVLNPFANKPQTGLAPEAVAAARPTFAAPVIDPAPFRQLRKYARVELTKSYTNGKEANLVDAGLALGRSFRVGLGGQGQVVHLGALYGNPKPTKSDALAVDKLRLVENKETSAAAALRLLKLQLAHTQIDLDLPSTSSPSGIPFATPSSDLRFHHFASLSPPADRSPEASLWRLGHALFDEIDDEAIPHDAAADTRAYIHHLRRKDRLQVWLEDAVKADVEDDLRRAAATDSAATPGAAAKRVFAMLTGHQVERACEAAVEAGDLRLATLLAQAGGDDEFREDLYLQLAKWREYRVEGHVAVPYRKVYELLCGNVGLSEGVAQGDKVDGAPAVHVSEGLDWKRAFGLQLWYGTFQSSVATAVDRYEAAAQADSQVAAPFPAYIEKPSTQASTSTTVWAPSKGEAPTDPLFELLKVFTSPTHPLERALLPRNFGSSPLDYRMSWHLYTLLSRVLRRRDFEDRVEVGEDGGEVEGNSVRADAVAESYAAQLESEGLWTWAAFVLLHLELPEKREGALRALLTRHAHAITDDDTTFLTETLKVPTTWVYAAQAVAAKAKGELFAEYKLLLEAEAFGAAHRVAAVELAPEAVIKSDFALVRRLFEVFDPQETSGWEDGGKVYLDFAQLVALLGSSPAEPETSTLLEDLLRAVPALLAQCPGSLKLQVAVGEMQSRLTKAASERGEALGAVRVAGLREGDRVAHLAGLNAGFLGRSLGVAVAA